MIFDKKIAIIIEARMTSSRLPGKPLLPILGKPALERMVERLRQSKLVDEIIVCGTTHIADDPMIELCQKINCLYFRANEKDMIKRDVLIQVLQAAEAHQVDIIVEVLGDCLCADWRHVDYLLEKFFEGNFDYAGNSIEKTFPSGFGVKIFSTASLAHVEKITTDPQDREHVSLHFYTHPEKYRLYSWKAPASMHWPELSLTLDTQEDYQLISSIYQALSPVNPDFSAQDVVDFLRKNQYLWDINKHVKRKIPSKLYVK
jgi:spore coat polysaccharide biosynthesis protein SpsF